jgi:hypothetical protein
MKTGMNWRGISQATTVITVILMRVKVWLSI